MHLRTRFRQLLPVALTTIVVASVVFPQSALAALDNSVEWPGVSHVSFQDRRPLCPVNQETFQVRLQTFTNDISALRVNVTDGSAGWVTGSFSHTRGPYDVWIAQVPAAANAQTSYWFELTDGTDVDYLSVSGMSDGTPGDGGFAMNFATLEHAPVGATLASGGACVFRVWAPNATSASVKGSFNGWNGAANPMTQYGDHWITSVAGVGNQQQYKFFFNGTSDKADARSRAKGDGDGGNSIVVDPLLFPWSVADFQTPPMEEMVLYQLHVGTFAGGNDPIPGAPHPSRFVDIQTRAAHLADLGVNAVMLNPVQEYPGQESAGYNPQNHWAVEGTYGSPDAFRNMVDALHAQGIAVLVDQVWNHFDSFANFMWFYDGTQIYFDTPAVNTPWGSQADFDDPNVRGYFLDAALHWLEEYRLDGWRMDGTDFMMGAEGWSMMQAMNDLVDNRFVDKVMIAEELPDDAWVTRPTDLGGAGFDSQYHGNFNNRLREEIFDAAFGDPEMWKIANIINGDGTYLQSRWVTHYLELHDEAWPTSGGQRMVKTIDPSFPHDDQWAKGRTKLAQGLVLFAPGVPALLMGTEWIESIDFGTGSTNKIDWAKKTSYPGIFLYYKDAIALRTSEPALRADAPHSVHHLNESGNVIGWHRMNGSNDRFVLIANFSNTDYTNYRVGIPSSDEWEEVINSQDPTYEGTGLANPGTLTPEAIAYDGQAQSLSLNLSKMAFVVLKEAAPTVSVEGPGLPGAPTLTLAAVRPTPALGNANIRFALGRDADMRLTLHDASGRRVQTLADGFRPAGSYNVRWNGLDHNGRNAAAGVYFLRLEAAGEVVTRRFPFVR